MRTPMPISPDVPDGPRDPLIQTRGREAVVMVRQIDLEGGKAKNPRCGSIHYGLRCQLINGHEGKHAFWKESPLIMWTARGQKEIIEEFEEYMGEADG